MGRISKFVKCLSARIDFNKQVRKWKRRLYHLFGVPMDGEDYKVETVIRFRELQSLAFMCLVTRRGTAQRLDQPISSRLKTIHFINRLLNLILIIRFIFLMVCKSSYLRLFAADPVMGIRKPNTFYLYIIIVIIVFGLIRECSLYLEEVGHFKLISKLIGIYWKDFSCGYIKLERREVRFCRMVFHFFLKLSIRIILIAFVLANLLPAMLRIKNMRIIFSNPILMISTIFWLLIENIVLTILSCSPITISTYVFLEIIVNYFQLKTLVHTTSIYVRIPHLSDHDAIMRNLNFKVIKFLNDFDRLNSHLKYFVMIYFLSISFCGDAHIFMGLIIHILDDIESIVLTIFGLYILMTVGLMGFMLGKFHSKFQNLHVNLTRLLTRSHVDPRIYFKTNEILIRLIHPETGAHIGDFFVIHKVFLAYYIAENMSTILLLTINF